MKWFLSFLLILAAFVLPATAKATAIGGDEFTKVVYIKSAAESPSPSASNNGRDYNSAKPLSTANIYAIPANVVITNVFVVVDEAFAGVTAFSIGDDDLSTGYVTSSSPNASDGQGLQSTGLKYWDVAYHGAYLKDSSVVANHIASKFYSATGKSIGITVTGTASRGQARVFIKGYGIGAQ